MQFKGEFEGQPKDEVEKKPKDKLEGQPACFDAKFLHATTEKIIKHISVEAGKDFRIAAIKRNTD